jgi:cystathionine beta-lyase
MTEYNFDQIISRGEDSGSYSAKWQGFEERFSGYNVEGAICMWVADMDFSCPHEVIAAVKTRAGHGIYGYTSPDAVKAFKKAASGWFERRYNYKTHTDWMLFIGGVVPAINSAIQEFTEPGDGVIVQHPVYYPFTDGVKDCNRTLQVNKLIETNGYYTMDFEDLEKLVKDPANKLMILSNPHNPVGRVWTRDELYSVCKLCCDNDVYILSDEIHADLIMKNHRFVSAGTLSDQISQNLITAFAPSKTFNIAGLGVSIIVVPNEGIRRRLEKRMLMNRYPTSNVFGPIAGEAAYLYGDKYVDELMEYIEGNIDYAIEFTDKHLKGVRVTKPQGTYLVWFDFRGTGMSAREINSFLLEKAKIAVDLGEWFGSGGEGFARFNFACPRSTVITAMNRMKDALYR